MPLSGEYEPSQNDQTREQVELYEATNVKGGTLNGEPVIVRPTRAPSPARFARRP